MWIVTFLDIDTRRSDKYVPYCADSYPTGQIFTVTTVWTSNLHV